MGEGFVGGARQSQPLPYATLTVSQIAALPVATLAAPEAHLYLWTTNRFLPEAFHVMTEWGFRYSTTLVWNKAMIGGGLGGTWRINTEFVLFGYRGRCRARGVVRGTCFSWKRPYDERGKPRHSAKPSGFLRLVEQVSHDPYLELFARAPRPGWAAWGNEIEGGFQPAEPRMEN